MAPRSSDEGPISSLGIRPPPRRNGLTQNADIWLEDKAITDGAEGLWRVHDGLYDLTKFISIHPGGSEWLELTKGTDITEAFEVHHLSDYPEETLKKYFVRNAKTKRNAPFTFHEDGFYRTLKKEVKKVVKTMPKQTSRTTDFLMDSLVLLTFTFSILANAYWNYLLALMAGSLLAMTTIAAHNYFHKKDNFRMYYFQFSLMQVREWRVSHVLSHHLHTNTIDDLEISNLEPFFQYMPIKKNAITKYGSWFWAPLMWIVGFHMNMVRKTGQYLKGDKRAFKATDLVSLLLPLAMFLLGNQSLLGSLWMWTVIILFGSTHFFFVGQHAAHHHPDIFHDGDTPRDLKDYDWGISQLDAVMDRKEITGSHFLVLTNFGDHALHHMFPTLDHGTLDHLYPVMKKTMEKFNINLRMVSQVDTILGSFQQLSKTTPNPNPPDLLKKYYPD